MWDILLRIFASISRNKNVSQRPVKLLHYLLWRANPRQQVKLRRKKLDCNFTVRRDAHVLYWWGLTFELTGALRRDGIWPRMKWRGKWRHAAMCPVERMVRPQASVGMHWVLNSKSGRRNIIFFGKDMLVMAFMKVRWVATLPALIN